jgi:uncharacterized membrane protein YphA (DoxX/SURF4 family)
VPRAVLPWVGLAIRLAAAAIWLVAGIAKLTGLEQFRAQVEAYRLLPHALTGVFAYALPLVEAGLGLYLLVGLLVRPAAIFTSVLMVAFLTAQIQAWARGLSLDCGCFGALGGGSHVGLWTVLRDAALGVPGLVLVVWPARKLSLDSALLGHRDPFERESS